MPDRNAKPQPEPYAGSETGFLLWSDLEECARVAFDIWVGEPELKWAREAWKRLSQNGFTAYKNELELCVAKIRFLAMAGIYHDWCAVAWEESVAPAYSEWAHVLKIRDIHLKQLVAGSPMATSEDDDEDQALGELLPEIISAQRPNVLTGLIEAYGDINQLFVSLWNSNKVDSPQAIEDAAEDSEDHKPDQNTSAKESVYEIFNFDMAEKAPAYEWLGQGAEELLDPW
jgi:hypothetical protein